CVLSTTSLASSLPAARLLTRRFTAPCGRTRNTNHRFSGRFAATLGRSMTTSFPQLDAAGTPIEMGRQHGEQCRDQLLAFLDYIQSLLRLSRSQLHARALGFLPLFEQHCPHILEEIRGLAEGASVPFADALTVQLRAELGQIPEGGCTTFVIRGRGTAGGQILI